jgi:hypothetical protein
LTTIDGELYIQNTAFSSLDLSHLNSVRYVSIYNNANLSLSLPGVSTLEQLTINTEPKATSLPLLASASSLNLSGTLPSTVSFPELTTVSQLYIDSSPLATLDVPKLATLTYLNLYYNPNLALSLPLITTLNQIQTQGGLQSLALNNLSSVAYVYFGSSAITSISFPALTSVSDAFQVVDSAAVTAVNVPSLKSITNSLQLANNALLASFNAPLNSHLYNLYIYNNPKFPQCRVAQIATATTAGYVYTTNNDNSATCP